MSSSPKELFRRHPSNPILTAKDWPYPANSVFNPAATLIDGRTLLLARVEDRRGMSHLTAARSDDGISNWQIDAEPTFPADPDNYSEELWGAEDPRITFVQDTGEYLITYTAYSEGGALVSLARTRDFKEFERLGPILPPDNKNAAIFPARFDGKWAMIHRPASPNHRVGTHMWICFSPDLIHWGGHRLLMRPRGAGWWDTDKIGLSTPPLETPEGWLLLYHGVRTTIAGCVYKIGAALLDLKDPTKILRRSDEWLFSPQEAYERTGDVDDVVFPCGWTLAGDEIRLYYGAADTSIALATASLTELLASLPACR